MRARTLVGVFWLVTIAGCGKNEDLVHPVSWYEQHGTERDAKVAWCVDDAQRQRTPDCMNAAEAKRRSLVGSQKDLKPIDWAASQAKP
jgi:DUF438 domain-containing protein